MADSIKPTPNSDSTNPIQKQSKDQTQNINSWEVLKQILLTNSSEENNKNREYLKKVLEEYTKNEIEKSSKLINDDLDKKIEKAIDKAKDKFKKETEASKIGLIESLAIFVALFAFISTNITIFSKVEYLSAAIWFMVLMLICLLIFLSVFHIFLKDKLFSWEAWLIPIFGIIILLILLGLSYNFEKLNPKINQQISENLSS